MTDRNHLDSDTAMFTMSCWIQRVGQADDQTTGERWQTVLCQNSSPPTADASIRADREEDKRRNETTSKSTTASNEKRCPTRETET